MTAEEVRIRTNENARTIGPTFGRLQSEYMDRLLARVIQILFYFNKFPQPPEALEGTNLKMRYVSPLAKAQKSNDVQMINYVVGQAAQMINVAPEIMDNVNFDKAFTMLVELTGAPNAIVNSKERVEEIRQQRAQAQEANQKFQMAMAQAGIADTMADTDKKTAMAEKYRQQAQKEAFSG